MKFEIDTNIDELLKIIWKHMREIKREADEWGRGGDFISFGTLLKIYIHDHKIESQRLI